MRVEVALRVQRSAVDRKDRVDHGGGEARAGAGDVDHATECRGHPVGGVTVAGWIDRERFGELGAPDQQDLGEQVVLRGEPPVDGGEGYPGAVGDGLHDHGVVAAGLRQVGRGPDDEVAAAGLLVRQDGGDQKRPAAHGGSLVGVPARAGDEVVRTYYRMGSHPATRVTRRQHA